MKISKTSWIYDFQANSFASNGERYIPSNLCPYMRRFVRLTIGTAFVVCVVIALLTILLYPLFMYLVPIGWMLVLAITGWGVVIGILITYWYKTYGKHKVPLLRVLRKIDGGLDAIGHRITHNIFIQWIKAAHDIVCPTIEFED